MRSTPTFDEEKRLRSQGYSLVAGIDEVGRGPLAGPVVAAAVILPTRLRVPWIGLVRDSKQLTPRSRQILFDCLISKVVAVGVGIVPSEYIDENGIIKATRLAMRQAVENLSHPPRFLLIDALLLPDIPIPQKGIKRGDSLCFSIAAASIIAKVTRDRMMVELDKVYPGYGFARHKGYGTREHLQNLQKLGPCPIHRKSFAPVRSILEKARV